MKSERIFTIASIVTFFALLPALIYMEVRVLREMPNLTYLFVIMDILLVAFMTLEIYLMIRKWRKGETKKGEEETEKVEIVEEWDEKNINSEITTSEE